MKLPTTDEAYVSYANAGVSVCGGGFPKGYRIPNVSGTIWVKHRQVGALPEGISGIKKVHLSVNDNLER